MKKTTKPAEEASGLQLWVSQQQLATQPVVTKQKQVIQQIFAELQGESGFVIENDDDYEFSGKLLKHSMSERKELKKKAEAVTKPINAALRAFRSWHQPPIKAWDAVIELLKQAMGEYEHKKLKIREEAALQLAEAAEAGDFEAAMEASQGLAEEVPVLEGLSSREVFVPDLERVDLSKVPVQYLALDMDAVKQYIKEFVDRKETPVDLPGLPFKREIRVVGTAGGRK